MENQFVSRLLNFDFFKRKWADFFKRKSTEVDLLEKNVNCSPITYILDTNIPVDDPYCLYKFQEHNITLPIMIFGELDSFKKGSEQKNINTREFSRMVDKLKTNEIFNDGVSLGPDLGMLKIALYREWNTKVLQNLKVENVDNEIINLAYCLKEENPEQEFIIVSRDINLRIKAMALGVLAEDYLHERVADIKFLSEEIINLEVPAEIIDDLYQTKQPVPYVIEDTKVNQNFILKAGNKSALAKYRNGSLNLITKGKQFSFDIKAKNAEQTFAMDALLDPNISIVTIEGKSGTGKTLISLACGLAQLESKNFEQVLFSRATISLGNHENGHLPGDIKDKIGPFMQGMEDNLSVLISANYQNKGKIDSFKNKEQLYIEPLAYIRGRSIHKAFFILDEAQNLTRKEIKAISTRAGEGTKFIFIGDTHQIDNEKLDEHSNGFSYLISKFQGQECHSHINLIKCERSELSDLAATLL